MASRTRRTWVWVNSGSWWWTGRPGVLWCMGSQRVWHNRATELNWTHNLVKPTGFWKQEIKRRKSSFWIYANIAHGLQGGKKRLSEMFWQQHIISGEKNEVTHWRHSREENVKCIKTIDKLLSTCRNSRNFIPLGLRFMREWASDN